MAITAHNSTFSWKDVEGLGDPERHFIPGLLKMRVRVALALVVMLAMALGRVREKRAGLMRSPVRAA